MKVKIDILKSIAAVCISWQIESKFLHFKYLTSTVTVLVDCITMAWSIILALFFILLRNYSWNYSSIMCAWLLLLRLRYYMISII